MICRTFSGRGKSESGIAAAASQAGQLRIMAVAVVNKRRRQEDFIGN
jgi:hypothetical protein